MNEATALILQKRIDRFFDIADPPVPDDKFAEMLAAMRADFPVSAIGKLPRVTCRDCSDPKVQCQRHSKQKCNTCDQRISTAHIHLDFVGHAHLTDRLNEVDPDWDWLPMAFDDDGLPKVSGGGSLWIILRFGGRFFQGIGDAGQKKGGDALKEMIGDALRNVSMRRGAALSLWMKERDVPEDADPAPGKTEQDAVNAAARATAKKAPAAPAKAAAKKATPAKAAAKMAAAPAGGLPDGVTAEDLAELTAAMAALEDPDQVRTWIEGRKVNPDTWEGITSGKMNAIRSAIKNMGKVQAAGNPPLSTPPEPAPPKPPAPPTAVNPRTELAERAEALPDAWASILKGEIIANVPGLSGSVGEVVMQAPDDADWSEWLTTWITDAETDLAKDPDAVPPGGEAY